MWVDLGHLFVLVLSDWKAYFLSCPNFSYLHLVKCQRTCLIRADIGGSSHDLASSQFLDIVLVFEHHSLRIGEREHDSKRKTFRDSYDNDSYSNSEEFDPLKK